VNELQGRIEKVIEACAARVEATTDPGFLPGIIRSLREMEKVLGRGGESFGQRQRRVGALFRIVSDDSRLLRSSLGERLVKTMNSYLMEGQDARTVRSSSAAIRRRAPRVTDEVQVASAGLAGFRAAAQNVSNTRGPKRGR